LNGHRRYVLYLLSIFLILSLAVGCTPNSSGTTPPIDTPQPADLEKISGRFFIMDTYVTITVYSSDKTKGQEAIDQAAAEFQRINNLVGRFLGKNLSNPQESDVYRVNEMAGISPVQVSDDTLAMIKRAIHFAELSGGLFDITIGPIMDLWGFGGEEYHIPPEDELKQALLLTGYQKIIVDEQAKTVYLPGKGMVMDLGGVAKGYATDVAVQKLRALGIKSGIINAGGNIFVLGSKPDGSPWKVGIRDPRDKNGHLAVVDVIDSAVISSGDYERYFEENGVRYHHIMDPSTGKQARGLMATTVIANNSMDADIFSTLMFVLGTEKGMEFKKTLPEVEIVFTNDRKEITYSDGLNGKIEFLNQ